MLQDTESMSTIHIIKKEQYPELLEKIKSFTKSENKIINRTVFNFKILLVAAINDKNNETIEYLKDGIENVIEYFSKELLDLINNIIDINFSIINVHYELLNDISQAFTQQILFNSKLEEFTKFKEFLLSI